jgi:PAS domain S-box-containing protein
MTMPESGHSFAEAAAPRAFRKGNQPIRVLVIDDSPIDRDLFRRLLLERNGARPFECIEGDRGRAGLEQFRRVRPSCVLLDLNLPDIDGLELLRSISGEPGAAPVIVITAHGSESLAVQAMKAGASDYVVKGSVTGESLAHVIENALEKRALQRELERQRIALEQRNVELESALERERDARRAVEQSESRYRTLAEAMPQVVWTAEAGGWDYVNERWTRLTGAPGGSAFGRGWLAFVVPEDRLRVEEAWNTAVRGETALELECRIVAVDGTQRAQLMRALPLVQGKLVWKWLGTFTDVENQRRAEHMLHHRQKLESVGILAGGVAHDFNNLLVGIIGGVSYALDVLPPEHEVRPILEAAFRSGERAADLTRQLLAYAGKGHFQVEDVDLARNLKATWELIQASLPRSVDLKTSIPKDLPLIHTDPSQLQQIIMNLILNASEAIPPERQGIITISAGTERLDAPRSTWSGDIAPGVYVSLEVSDNGNGIHPSLLNKIFDPFFTTKFTGRGLGLAAVLGIVRSNKGSIEVKSTPGAGTTFRVLLGAGIGAGAASSASNPAPRAHPVKGRILVVDDEPVVRDTAKAVLEREGHEVDVVSSGREALELLTALPYFSLVLLDFSMPELSGKQTLEAIRNRYPHLPVIICSGFSDSEVRTKFEGFPVSGFLQKPFHSHTLAERVAQILSPE